MATNRAFVFPILESGLELIEKWGLQSHSTLVTSHYNEDNVQESSIRLNVKIIPKECASVIPILFIEKVINPDLQTALPIKHNHSDTAFQP